MRLTIDLPDAHELPEDSRSLPRVADSRTGRQKFALRKMGDFSTPGTVTLIEQLRS
jgi:hypothetical protein